MGRGGDPGHSGLLRGDGGRWPPPWALARGGHAAHGHGPHLMPAVRGVAAPPMPEKPGRPRPSRGEGGGRLGINSAGGKVRPPARPLPRPRPQLRQRGFHSRAHTRAGDCCISAFSSLLCLLCPGGGCRGVNAPSPGPSPRVGPFRKTPKAIICLRIPFETATRKTNDCSFPSVSDPRRPFIWLSLEPRPRLFVGRLEREAGSQGCDVAKD